MILKKLSNSIVLSVLRGINYRNKMVVQAVNMNKKMPVIFAGHGSPMNAIENNQFTKQWAQWGRELPRPQAILCVSAHWYVNGDRVNDSGNPNIIYDMFGFPRALYELQYPAKGSPQTAQKVLELLSPKAVADNGWGIDHGSWSVLCKIYPQADIPVLQLSVNRDLSPAQCYENGKKLAALRDSGVLILASGNVVHNLSRVNWNMENEGYDWAYDFDSTIKDAVLSGDVEKVINYKKCANWDKAVNYPDHYMPLLYALGAADGADKVTVYNNECVLGALSMISYIWDNARH